MRSSDAQEDTFIHEDPVALGLDSKTRVRDFLYAERWTGFSLLLHTVGLLCVSLMPPQSSALALDMLSDDTRYARYLAAPIETIEENPFRFGEGQDAPESARAADSEGQAGRTDAPRKVRRMSGGSKNATVMDPASQAREAGILGVLARTKMASGPGTFNALSAGGGELEAYGAIMGAVVGDSFGFNGLGMRGTGRGGGGDAIGSIGVGKLGTVGGGMGGSGTCPGCAPALRGPHHDARVPSLRSGTPDVRGSLSKEVIRRVIQRHLNEVRFCYEQNLRSLPELSGRVEVKFVISPSGAVQGANVATSSLSGDQGRTGACISEAVKRWSFPAPDGGGVVIVTYPFVLEAPGP